MSAPYDVLVRVVWGEHHLILWQRREPAWHLARSFDEYAGATVTVEESPSERDLRGGQLLPGSYGSRQ